MQTGRKGSGLLQQLMLRHTKHATAADVQSTADSFDGLRGLCGQFWNLRRQVARRSATEHAQPQGFGYPVASIRPWGRQMRWVWRACLGLTYAALFGGAQAAPPPAELFFKDPEITETLL